MNPTLRSVAETLGEQLRRKGWRLALAESCTGGGISQAVTDIPGSSQWFDRGFVTYSNDAKIDMLGISPATLEQFGAVSRETALAMAAGALSHSQADLALAVTGIAGPSGGTKDKPVGTVFIAWQRRDQLADCQRQIFPGDRQAIRQQTAEFCLKQALRLATED